MFCLNQLCFRCNLMCFSRYFSNASVRDDHFKTKKHKKRLVGFFLVLLVVGSPLLFLWIFVSGSDSNIETVVAFNNYIDIIFVLLVLFQAVKNSEQMLF